MDTPVVMEKVLEKLKEMSGLGDILTDVITIGVGVNVELKGGQYNELINMLNSMGYNIYNMGEYAGGSVMEVYHNRRTGEFISFNYTKGIKYKIKYIIYYRGNNEVHS